MSQKPEGYSINFRLGRADYQAVLLQAQLQCILLSSPAEDEVDILVGEDEVTVDAVHQLH